MNNQEVEYEARKKRLYVELKSHSTHLDGLVTKNEDDYCEIRAEIIIQWENSVTICERDIKINDLEYRLEKGDSKTVSYDDTRDVSIRTIANLIKLGHLEDNDDHYFEIQDTIQDEINEVLGLDIDDNFEISVI
jgi:hypothetical protein